MVDEKELDKFIEGELNKDITQEDKVDESVEQHMGEMGFLWNRVQEKMQQDAVCYSCKGKLEFEKGDVVHIVEATKVENGVVAFVSICNKCKLEEEKAKKEADKQKVKKNE